MDKWGELTGRIKNSILAEEPEAAVAAAFDYLAEFGRQLQRIADALEPVNVEQAPEEQHPQLPLGEPGEIVVHDL